jgi:hypothetical protein
MVVVLLSFVILINVFFEKGKKDEFSVVNYSNVFIPILLIFFLALMLFFKSIEGSRILPNVNLLVIHFLFLAFFINTKQYINDYIKAYIYLAFLMAICGLLADFLFVFNFVDEVRWSVNLNELSNGAYRRDMGREVSYLFPWNLGFILNGGNLYDFAGFQFYRISGWAHEPTSASLFIAPAIIFLIHSDIIKSSFKRLFMLSTIVTFWIFVIAVGSLAAFIVIYSVVLFAYLYTHYYPKKLSIFLFGFFIILAPFILINLETIFNSSIIFSKIDTNSDTFQTAVAQLTWAFPENFTSVSKYAFDIFLWAIILTMLSVAINGIIYRSFVDAKSLALLYLVVHSMKGSQESVFLLIFSFFWFYVSYYGEKK